MKKIITIALITILLASFTVQAQQMTYAKTSGSKTESALIYSGETMFSGIVVATDGTNAVTLDIKNGTTSGGTNILPQIVIPTSATNRSFVLNLNPGILCRSGIYIVVSTSGTVGYAVTYK